MTLHAIVVGFAFGGKKARRCERGGNENILIWRKAYVLAVISRLFSRLFGLCQKVVAVVAAVAAVAAVATGKWTNSDQTMVHGTTARNKKGRWRGIRDVGAINCEQRDKRRSMHLRHSRSRLLGVIPVKQLTRIGIEDGLRLCLGLGTGGVRAKISSQRY